jgi:hypothetical protein
MFAVPKIRTAWSDEGIANDTALDTRFVRFASELEWYGQSLERAAEEGRALLRDG